MNFIFNTCTDPYFNLAAEEHLLDNSTNEVFMLWRNSPCVVIGRNQNISAEIDLEYVQREQITVSRRNSGGGAVFHDLGNVNFTFISESAANVQTNFIKFTQPIIAALKTLGIASEFSGRNDITVNGAKVSGNAQYYRGNKVLHHGTLLYSGDIGMLAAALKPNRQKLQAKGIASVQSRVANLATFLTAKHPVEWFMHYLFNYCRRTQVNAKDYSFTKSDYERINCLRATKYVSRDWNFGKTSRHNYCAEQRFPAGCVGLFMEVQNRMIIAVEIRGDYFGKRCITGLEQKLVGVPFCRAALLNCLADAEMGEYLTGISMTEFVSLLPLV